VTPRERLGADVDHADVSGYIDVAQLSSALGHAEIVVGYSSEGMPTEPQRITRA
jgi:hypothetical protein